LRWQPKQRKRKRLSGRRPRAPRKIGKHKKPTIGVDRRNNKKIEEGGKRESSPGNHQGRTNIGKGGTSKGHEVNVSYAERNKFHRNPFRKARGRGQVQQVCGHPCKKEDVERGGEVPPARRGNKHATSSDGLELGNHLFEYGDLPRYEANLGSY